MGQYHILVNLDKHEYIYPPDIGDGLKLWEQGASLYGTITAAMIMLAASNRGGTRGGGDLVDVDNTLGSWAGDRVCWVGDYAYEQEDIPNERDVDTIYARCTMNKEQWDSYVDEVIQPPNPGYHKALPLFTNVSVKAQRVIMANFPIVFSSSEGKKVQRLAENADVNLVALSPDMIIQNGQVEVNPRFPVE